MRRLLSSEARKDFSDVVHRAYYAKEITVITKRGRDLAAVVPMSMVQAAARSEARVKSPKPPRPATRQTD
jgi:prevent-host-death family protein